MSVPPQLIRVKRKAAEETPVPYLRMEILVYRSYIYHINIS